MQPTPVKGRRHSGVTLIELLTVLAIVMVVAWSAVPPLAAWQARLAVETEARALFAMLTYAGAQARRLGRPVTVCPMRRREAQGDEAPMPDCRSGADWSGGYAAVADSLTRPSLGVPTGLPSRTVLRVQGPSDAVTINSCPAGIIRFDPPTGRTLGAWRHVEVAARGPGGRDACRCLQCGAGGAWHVSEGRCGPRRPGPGTGVALLEVLVALALLGIAGVGAAGMQHHATRALQGAQWRVMATWLAQSAAELMRAGLTAPAAESALGARAAAQLPGGGILIADADRECRRVNVCWAEQGARDVPGQATPAGDVPGQATPAGDVPGHAAPGGAPRRCVSIDVLS